MTLQQLRYVTTVAETGIYERSSPSSFVSQPGLTKAIRELEQEMGIIIFDRTNKGIEVSKDGAMIFRICKAGAGAGITFGRAL